MMPRTNKSSSIRAMFWEEEEETMMMFNNEQGDVMVELARVVDVPPPAPENL